MPSRYKRCFRIGGRSGDHYRPGRTRKVEDHEIKSEPLLREHQHGQTLFPLRLAEYRWYNKTRGSCKCGNTLCACGTARVCLDADGPVSYLAAAAALAV